MLIYDLSPICIALQETMVGNNKIPCPRQYVVYHSPYIANHGSHGGALLYIRHDIPHVVLNINSTLQVIAVQIHLQRKYTICSVYLPPGGAFPRDEFLDLIQQLPQPFFNIRGYEWQTPSLG